MEQQPEFGFTKELELKPPKSSEGVKEEPKNLIEETEELPLDDSHQTAEIKHYPAPCQYCEDSDPNCRYCQGRNYSE